MTSRTFYKKTFQIDVLSEEPIPDNVMLADINYNIVYGNWCGKFTERSGMELDGIAVVEELEALGSEPGFFMLDDNGNDLD